ncbi:MAG: ATP-binding protein [Chitinophagaceae bacterium]
MPKENIHILYVDDDEDDFLLLRMQMAKLTSRNYIVERAASFEEALEKYTGNFDIVLLDYRLGKEDGLELLRIIKERRRFLPVIMLTGMEDSAVDSEALKFGASDYLVKGAFKPHELERAIRYAITAALSLQDLEVNSNRFRMLFQKSADPIIIINKKGDILNWNPSFENLFPMPETIGKWEEINITELMVEQESVCTIRKALEEGNELGDFEAQMHRNGSKPVNVMLNMILHDVESGNYQIMIKDITSVKEKEVEAQTTRKFASTGRIARVLAHEIKNPLTNISLSIDQLKYDLPEPVLKDSVDLLEMIDRNSKRINELINQLLDATRYTELKRQPYPINQLVEETLEQAKDTILLKEIKVVKDLDKDERILMLDVEKIKIVLFNLIINAIDAMEGKQGILTLRTSIDNKRSCIEVADNGIGLTPEQLDKIFEPFYTSKPQGTGLGLTNAQGIMISHQGLLKVKSKAGVGTSFYMVFPEE